MLYQKTLLINPKFRVVKGRTEVFNNPPLGLLSMASNCSNHTIDIIDLNVNNISDIDLNKRMMEYDLIGVSCMTQTLKETIKLCSMAKELGKTTIIGGYHPTLLPSVINEFACIDMIVKGDGEITLKEVLNGKSKEDILGLSYRENGEIYSNKDRPLIKNLDELPIPLNRGLDVLKYQFGGVHLWSIETTRGCPFTCNFCAIIQFNRHEYREKSPERVLLELEQIPNGVKMVHFTDDNFTFKKKRVLEICKLIQENGFHKKYEFITQARVEDIANNPDMVKEMYKSGFRVIFMGIESLSQKCLDSLNKNSHAEKAKIAMQNLQKLGMFAVGAFIIGNIGETADDVRENVRLATKLGLDATIFVNLAPFPSTPLYKKAVENNWIQDGFKWENWDGNVSFMRTSELTIDEINRLNAECSKKYVVNAFDLVLKLEIKWAFKHFFQLYKYRWIFKHIPIMLKHSLKNMLRKY